MIKKKKCNLWRFILFTQIYFKFIKINSKFLYGEMCLMEAAFSTKIKTKNHGKSKLIQKLIWFHEEFVWGMWWKNKILILRTTNGHKLIMINTQLILKVWVLSHS